MTRARSAHGRWRRWTCAAVVAAMAALAAPGLAAGLFGPARAVAAEADPVASSGSSSAFARGVEAYGAGRYEDARRVFETLERAGWRSGPLYYDLGNAALHTGDLAAAIRAYRLAERYLPRDRDLEHDLELALSLVEQPVARIGFEHALRSLAFWYDYSTRREASLVALVAWLVLLAATVTWRHRPGRATATVTVLAAVVFALAGLTSLAKRVEIEHLEHAVIAAGGDQVRATPDPAGAERFPATEGVEVRILETEGAYARIRREDGREGWLRRDHLLRLDTPPGAAS